MNQPHGIQPCLVAESSGFESLKRFLLVKSGFCQALDSNDLLD